jgi:hypothetical protein
MAVSIVTAVPLPLEWVPAAATRRNTFCHAQTAADSAAAAQDDVIKTRRFSRMPPVRRDSRSAAL